MGKVVAGGQAHGSGIEAGDLVVVAVGGDVAERGEDVRIPADALGGEPHFFQGGGIAREIPSGRGDDERLFAQQGQRVGDVARAASAQFVHVVHHEAHAERMQLVHEHMILEIAVKGHNAVKGQRTGNIDGHAYSLWWLRVDGVGLRGEAVFPDPAQESGIAVRDGQGGNAGDLMGMPGPHMGAEVRQGRLAHLRQQHDLRRLADSPLPAVRRDDAGQNVDTRGQPGRNELAGQKAGGVKAARPRGAGDLAGEIPQAAFLRKGDIDKQHEQRHFLKKEKVAS